MGVFTPIIVGGGAGYDQSLNTTNDVEFNSLVLATPYNPFNQDLDNNDNVQFAAINITGELNLTGSAGTSGQVLTSAGDGVNPTWEDLGAISNPFDQELNTTDEVEFDKATIQTELIVNAPIKANGSQGTSGQVLKSQGIGSSVIWGDPSSDNPFDQDLNTGDNVTFVGLTTTGPVKIITSTVELSNGKGTNGQVFTSHGSGAEPAWENTANPFNQDLNTTNNVQFDTVTTTSVTGDGSGLTGLSAIADGTYTVGIGPLTNGTITFVGGRITAIQEAT